MSEERRHIAILFSDIVSYTSLMGSDENKALDMLARNRTIHEAHTKQFKGTLIKDIGDAVLSSFSLASDAVRCAIEIQKSCKEDSIPLKIGIHEGEVVFKDSDVFGDGVNIASRLQSDAQQGCISISGSVYRDIKNKPDIQTKFIKEKTFKNVDEPIKVYQVLCDGEEPEQQTSINNNGENLKSKKPYYIIAGIVVVAIAILFIWKIFPSKEVVESEKSIFVLPFKEVSELEKSIAILPFDYLSEDQSKQYLADGVVDKISSNLGKISELKVIASVERYRDHSMDVRDIGKEIDVSYIVEGSFQLVGDKARLIIELINTKDGSHVWSNEYDRDWSDIFKVQSEVSQTIAKEIAIKITPETREIIETHPTNDLTAYDYYLKGREYQQRSTYEEDLRNAIQMYENALRIDSSFVLAWVGLAGASRRIFWYGIDRSEEHLTRIKKYLDYAVSLSPNSKEVRHEEAMYEYHCKLNYLKALRILQNLKDKYPNDEYMYFRICLVYRRMGEFIKSLEYNNIAISLNPSNWQTWLNAGYTLQVLRKYNDAEKYFKKAIHFNPSYHIPYKVLLRLYANTGQIIKAREFLINNQRIIKHPDIKLTQAYIEVLDGNYKKAIQIIESLSEDAVIEQEHYQTKHLQLGLIYFMMSNNEMALEHFESEKVFLLSKIDLHQNDCRLYKSLGIAYAGLGMKEKAIEAGEKALNIKSFSNDVYGGVWTEIDMVKILVMVGECEDTLTRLENILSHHGNLTADVLQLDPFWNPIREMDGFKAIVNNPAYQVNLSDN